MTTFTGTTGDDSFTGTSSDDIFDLQQGGKDIATGQGGDDLFNLGAELGPNDQLDGGDGTDTVTLDGDYASGLTFNATTMVNVERLTLAGGNSYSLTTNNATVAAGAVLTVDGSALGAGNSLTFNGVAELDGSFNLIGGAGDDILRGGDHEPNVGAAVFDFFDLSEGGNDSVTGGYNNTNIVQFGDTFTAADSVDGFTGAFGTMTIVLDGDYTGAHAVVLGPTTLVAVDKIILAAGHSYDLTSAYATFGHHGTLVDASGLGATDTLAFDGSAASGGAFHFIGGAGNDTLIEGWDTGSSGFGGTFDLTKGGNDTVMGGFYLDTFEFGATLTATDRIDGGRVDSISFGDVVALDGDYSGAHALTFAAATMINVEKLTLAAGHSYNLTTNNATVAATGFLRVDGSSLAAGNVLTFNGSAETDGGFVMLGGAGNDVLTGGTGTDSFDLSFGGNDTVSAGAGDDSINLGAKLNASDQINAGTGFDAVDLNGDYSAGVVFNSTTLVHIEFLTLHAGHSYKLTTADTTVLAGAHLDVEASDLASGRTVYFDGSAETNGSFSIASGAGNDTLIGGAKGDDFTPGAGVDTIKGGAGDDLVNFGAHFSAQDSFDGGSGSDTVILDEFISGGVTLSAADLKSIENLYLQGHSYNITTTDDFVASGVQLFVQMDNSTASHTLRFDASAETNGFFGITGGLGNDHITTGDGRDAMTGGGGADFLRGGLGDDFYFYFNTSDSTGAHYDTIFGFNTADDTIVSGDISAINTKVAHGSLSTATFDTDMAAAITAGHLGAHHAVLFTPDAGSLAGRTFLIIDDNGQAGYQAGDDYVIRLQNGFNLSQLSVNDFS